VNPAQRQRGPSTNQQASQANVPGLAGPTALPTGPDPTGGPPAGQVASTDDYVAFELPWTLNVGFGVSYTAPGPRGQVKNQPLLATNTINVNGSLKLTPKWAITYSAPFDIRTKQLVFPNVAITRDLHCWVLSAYWVPVGAFQSYVVNLGVKSSILADLKVMRNRSWSNR
jgi:hypothetical protein